MKRCKMLSAIIFLIFFHFLPKDVHAVPTLQLYSENAFYDTTTESWMTYENPFVLQVQGADQPNNLNYIDQVKLYIAVPSQYYNQFGSVRIEGVSSSLEQGFSPATFTSDMFTKVPPVPPDLARSHGIYNDAYYVTVPLENLDVNKNPSDTIINYVDIAEDKTPPGTGTGDIDLYKITYSDFFLIHMDLTGMTHYNNSKKDAMKFAPFSHDADAVIPEPGSLLLLGIGFIGLAVASRFFPALFKSEL